MLAAFEALPVF